MQGAENLADFITLLRKPRAVMLLVPAGPIVDAVIRDLLPYLEPGDLVIDAGNSHFKDTDLRQSTLEVKVAFLRHGSFRRGSRSQAWAEHDAWRACSKLTVVRPVSWRPRSPGGDDPCVAYLGPGSAGHYVKMVHNGIEYGLMQLIAETYDLLRLRFGPVRS